MCAEGWLDDDINRRVSLRNSPVGAGTGSCVGRRFGVAAEGRGEKKKKAKKMAAIVDGVDRYYPVTALFRRNDQ